MRRVLQLLALASVCTAFSLNYPSGSRKPARWQAVVPGQVPSVALLFDCDGVIVETEELHRLAYNGAFEAFGLEVDGQPVLWDTTYYDKLQNTVGGGKPKMRWHFKETMGGRWPVCTKGLWAHDKAPADEVTLALFE